MRKEFKKEYSLIIDTDSYAGNFERELCAYLTGHIGECGVGSKYVDDDVYNKFEGLIEDRPDYRGTLRPCTINNSYNGKYNSVEIYFSEKPTEELINLINLRLKDLEKEFNLDLKVLQIRMAEYSTSVIYKKI